MEKLKNNIISILRWSEKYTQTDMVYLAKNSFWVNLNTVLVTAFSFALSIAFARLVSKDTYGTYQFIISVASVLGAFTLTGMNAAVAQAIARGLEGVLQKSVRVQIKYGLIPFLLGIAVSTYYLLNGNQVLSFSILAIAAVLPVTNALNTWTALVGSRKDFKQLFVYNQIINVLYYAGMFAIIIFFPQTIALVLANYMIGLGTNLWVYRASLKKYKPNSEHEEEALNYGKKLSFSNVFPSIILNLDNILVFHLLGAANLAIYAFASNIPERFVSLIRPVSTISFPKFSTKNADEMRTILPQKIVRFALLAAIFGLVYIFIAPYVYQIFFPQYMQSVFYSQVYVLASIISSIGGFVLVSLFAIRSRKIFSFNIINPLFNIAVILIGAYTFGIWGVIFARIAANAFSLALGYFMIRHK